MTSNATLRHVVFIDRDGVINQDSEDYILTPEQFIFLPQSREAIGLINQQEWLCLIVTNQSAFARGWLTPAQFQAICQKMHDGLREIDAWVDDLFYCPHYPRWQEGMVRELSHPCDCRKPGTGLFEQAAQRYAVQPAQAVLIGDKTSDFEAAARWGMPSIGVKTGYAGQDKNYERTPTRWAENLWEAVQGLVEQWP